MRPKTRGEGFTTQKADAELRYPDGRVLMKQREVDNAIKEILGIDRSQFMQISMIAQGDFLKLLLATTEDRKAIFRQIFKTQLFQYLQEKLKRESGDLNNQREAAKSSLKQYINGIVVDDADVLSIEVAKAKSDELPLSDTLALLQRLIHQDEDSEITLTAKKELVEEQLEIIIGNLSKIETWKQAEESIKKNRKYLEIEEEAQIELKKAFEDQKDLIPETAALTDEKFKLEAELSRYDSLDALMIQIQKLQVELNSKEKAHSIRVGTHTAGDKELTALKVELQSLSNAGENKERLAAAKEKAVDRKKRIFELINARKAYTDDAYALSKLQEEYLGASKKSSIANADYEAKNKAFLNEQAGIIAETLEDGKPCPVCGSVNHPHCAKKSEHAPTEAQLKKAKKEADEANKAAQEKSEACASAKASLSASEWAIRRRISELEFKCDYDYDDIDDVLRVASLELETEIKRLSDAIEAEAANVSRKEELEIAVPQKELSQQGLKESIDELSKTISGLRAEAQSKTEQYENERSSLRFDSKLRAEQRVAELGGIISQQKAALEKAEEAYQKSAGKIRELKAAISGLEEQLSEDLTLDSEVEAQEKAKYTNRKLEIEESMKAIHARLAANRSSLSHIVEKSGDLDSLEKRFTWVNALSNTANGNIKGKEKIMLETYIQMTFFDRIIARANTRFMVMSGGQYELKRREEAENNRSQTGLDLDVIDHYNGTERSVKTLSGGESFKASLSLALGLSDEIQSSAGGVRLDTMFVDEGFGSLDGESLDQAMKALVGLADGNRLVGVISHVSELKDRIDKQIIVTKEQSGGSKATIIV